MQPETVAEAKAWFKKAANEGVHQYVADDALTDEHYRNHREPTAQAALARRAGAELVREQANLGRSKIRTLGMNQNNNPFCHFPKSH